MQGFLAVELPRVAFYQMGSRISCGLRVVPGQDWSASCFPWHRASGNVCASLCSDFLILPGFIDFTADEVVSLVGAEASWRASGEPHQRGGHSCPVQLPCAESSNVAPVAETGFAWPSVSEGQIARRIPGQ